MTEAEREARHPQPDAPLKQCHRCKGTGEVGKVQQFSIEAGWERRPSICPVCEGRGYERMERTTQTAH